MVSIRRALLIWLLLLLLLAGAFAATGLYYRMRDEANALFDYHLEQMALSLRDQALEQPLYETPDEIQYDFIIQIWSLNGERIYLSHPHSALPIRAQLGFQTVDIPEGAWRVYTTQLRGRVIEIAQPLSVREQLARRLALHTLLPFALLVPVLGILVWLVVGWGLNPLRRLAQELQQRSPRILSPLAVRGLPAEVRPLVQSLNGLLQRLERSIDAQRSFIADAAHELRTPLTAIQLQLQLAERAGSENEREAAFSQLRSGVRRAIHMVEQLLSLARQEPDVSARPFVAVDLSQIATQVVAEQAPLAAAKGMDLGIGAADGSIRVAGDADALHAMLSNLVDNAVRYALPGGRIDVSVQRQPDSTVLSVVDDGPGIPAEERERVLDRFYRREGSGERGAGLGLAIVKNVVARHKATLTLSDGEAGKGLRVTIRFGDA